MNNPGSGFGSVRLVDCGCRRFRQRGQVLPLGLLLLLCTILTGAVVFNTGQATSTKVQLANTADAAVYSGLLWQARAMNFQAYTNRAMVANQVTMAQAVSLRSWLNHALISSENANSVLGGLPVIGAVTQGMQQVSTIAARLLAPVTTSMLSVVNTFNSVLGQAQETMFAAAFVATPDILVDVVRQNNPEFSINTGYSIAQAGQNLSDWQNFTVQRNGSDVEAMRERVDIINRSRDAFTRGRNWEFFDRWFYFTPFVRMKLYRQGETRLLVANQGLESNAATANIDAQHGRIDFEWKAKDNLSLNTRIWRPFRGEKKLETPIGWSQATARASERAASTSLDCNMLADPVRGNLRTCDDWFHRNRLAEDWSDQGMPSLQGTASRTQLDNHYAGLRAFRDLNQLTEQNRDPRLLLRLEVEAPLGLVPQASEAGFTDAFELLPSAPGDALASLASAELYFERPDTAPGELLEHANAYNPYWDVRLAPVSTDERLTAWSIRGLNPTGQSRPAREATVALARYEQGASMPVSAGEVAALAQHASPAKTEAIAVSFTTVQATGLKLYHEHIAGSNVLDGALKTALQDVASEMLSGAIAEGAVAVGMGNIDVLRQQERLVQKAQETVDRVAPWVDELESLARRAEQQTARVEAEFQRIRDRVAQQYETVRQQVHEEFLVLRGSLERQIEQLHSELTDTLPEDTLTGIQQQLFAVQEQYERLNIDLELALAARLAEIVNSSTSLIHLDTAEALKLVRLHDTAEGDLLRESENRCLEPTDLLPTAHEDGCLGG